MNDAITNFSKAINNKEMIDELAEIFASSKCVLACVLLLMPMLFQ